MNPYTSYGLDAVTVAQETGFRLRIGGNGYHIITAPNGVEWVEYSDDKMMDRLYYLL